MERILHITFRRDLRPTACLQRIDRMVGLRRTGEETRTQRYPATSGALKAFAKQDLRKSIYDYVRSRDGLSLTPRARQLLKRPVRLTTYEYESVDGFGLRLDLARRNEIPVFGEEMWVRQRVPMVGGFITIIAPSSRKLEALSAKFIRSFHPILRRTVSRS